MADTQKKNTISVSAKAETVTSKKSEEQKKKAEEIEKRQKEAEGKADQARKDAKEKKRQDEEARKKAEEEKKREEEKAKQKAEKEAEKKQKKKEKEQQELLESVTGTTAALLAAAGKGNKKKGGFFKGLLIGLLIGVLGTSLITCNMQKTDMPAVAGTVEPAASADVTIDNNGFLGYTAADFQDAVLGEAKQKQELEVFEQELTIPTTITKAGLGNLNIFSKVKNVTYHGEGVYTVDLSNIDKDHVLVDLDRKEVTVQIPHAKLAHVIPDLSATEFEDTEHGLLAFGDIKLTAEEQKELESSVTRSMKDRLSQQDLLREADRFAKLSTWEIFQPLITAVSPEFKVIIEFED